MSPALDSLPLWDFVAPAVVVLLGVFLVGGIFFWWGKNVLRNRLPRPFLGDGPNMEWAEMKKAELDAHKFNSAPMTDDLSEGAYWLPEHEDPIEKAESTGFDQNGPDDEMAEFEASVAGNEEALLIEWMKESDHIDDPWVKRLLEKKRTSEEC